MSNAMDDAERAARHDLAHMDWRFHHISLPEMRGDFTKVRRDEQQEARHSALEFVLEVLGLADGRPGAEAEPPDREAGS